MYEHHSHRPISRQAFAWRLARHAAFAVALFAGCYPLFSGLVFLIVAGVLLAPTVHRALHYFHWVDEHQLR